MFLVLFPFPITKLTSLKRTTDLDPGEDEEDWWRRLRPMLFPPALFVLFRLVMLFLFSSIGVASILYLFDDKRTSSQVNFVVRDKI